MLHIVAICGHPSPPASIGRRCSSREHRAQIPAEGENTPVDLARFGWLAVVLACLIAVVILGLQGYFGYAGVTLAVALSAAINLR
jgi:hypothetical protein